MNLRRISRACLVAALATLGGVCGLDTALAVQPSADAGPEEIQVLARGPVHAAFAETVTYDPQPGIIVAEAPPEPIEELPPELKPEGDNVTWIPGYWAWDDDTDKFLWVSGIWRALPPGREWVSGYWSVIDQGAQWTSGYWTNAVLAETEYLPEPPASVEAGPNIDAPSPDSNWIPGCWIWRQNRYAWQPGTWTTCQPNWVWIPAHYHWCPRGYVYVDGYWDHSVIQRGVMFAPVSFQQSVYSRRGFSYTPMAVINLSVFANHLFVRPNYSHYYYGDYYGSSYANVGFYPSYSFNSTRYGYDPIFAHQRWSHRQDRDWEGRIQADFQNRNENEEARPLRTFAAQQELSRQQVTEENRTQLFAQTLDQAAKVKTGTVRFQPLDQDDRQRLGRQAQEVRVQQKERQKIEISAIDPTVKRPARPTESVRVKRSRSPIVAKGADELDKDHSPPKSQPLPNPDAKIVPKQRQPGGRVQPVEGTLPSDTPKGEPKPAPKPVPGVKPPKTEPMPKDQPEPKDEPIPKPRVNPPKGEPKPVPKAEPKPVPRVDPPKAAPKPPKAEPKPVPKFEPKPVPRIDPPKAEPKPAPKPVPPPKPPKAEPKPAPKVEPKPAPKPVPKPAPKVEPKPAPPMNPPPPPKVEPKPAPKEEEKPKGEPKEPKKPKS